MLTPTRGTVLKSLSQKSMVQNMLQLRYLLLTDYLTGK